MDLLINGDQKQTQRILSENQRKDRIEKQR